MIGKTQSFKKEKISTAEYRVVVYLLQEQCIRAYKKRKLYHVYSFKQKMYEVCHSLAYNRVSNCFLVSFLLT
jgi:hypothetical protein